MYHFLHLCDQYLDELSEFETVKSDDIPSSRQMFLTLRMRLSIAEGTIRNLNTQLTGNFILGLICNSIAFTSNLPTY